MIETALLTQGECVSAGVKKYCCLLSVWNRGLDLEWSARQPQCPVHQSSVDLCQ